ncbi:MAG: hypothetical protein KY459_00645 [Acidobacteria bacterium]|nr:hypothetical protein [Acidobacteriota bacterium]
MLGFVGNGPARPGEKPLLRLLDGLAGAGYALGWFITFKKFVDIPFQGSSAVGRITVDEVSKLQDYARAGLFYLTVPLLAVAFMFLFSRVRKLGAADGGGVLRTLALAAPFIFSAPLYLVTRKELWSILLPLLIAAAVGWVAREDGWGGRARRVISRQEAWIGLIIAECAALLIARYLVVGRRIAHMDSLLLETILVGLLIAVGLAIVILAGDLIAARRESEAGAVRQAIAAGAAPLLLLAPAALWPDHFPMLAFAIGVVAIALTAALIIRRVEVSERFGVAVLVWFAVPLLLAVVTYGSVADPNGWIDLFHRGESLGPASDYLAGDRPYADVFPLHGLLEDGLLDAFLMSIFGRSIDVAIYRMFLLSAMMIPAVWLLSWWAFRSVPLALAAAALTMLVAADNQRAVLEIFAAAFLLKGLAEDRWRLVAMGGIVGGIDLFFSLETGLYVLGGGLLAIAIGSLITREAKVGVRRAGIFIVGYLAGMSPFIFYLAMRGVVGDFFEVSFIRIPSIIDAAWSLPVPDVGPWLVSAAGDKTLFQYAWHLRYILNPFVIAAGLFAIILMVIRRTPQTRIGLAIVVLTAFSLISQRSALGRADFQHQWFSAFLIGPLLIALLIYWTRAWEGRDPSDRFVARLIAIMFALLFVGVLWAPGLIRNRLDGLIAYGARLVGELPTAQLIENRERTRAVTAAIRSHTAEDDAIFDFSNQPVFYFLADRRNPTRYFQVPLMSPPDAQREVIDDLHSEPPALVLMTSPERYDRFDEVSNARRAPEVARWIRSRYRWKETVHGIELWTKRAIPIRVASNERAADPDRGSSSVFPNAGAGPGVGELRWETDLLLVNRHKKLASVELRYLSGKEVYSRIVDVDPESHREFRDVTTGLLGAPPSTGPLTVRYLTEARPEVRLRSRSSRGGRSQWFQGLDQADAANERLEFVGLIAQPGDRVNLALVNMGYGTAVADVIMRDADGDRIGIGWRATIPEERSALATGIDRLLEANLEDGTTIEANIVRGKVGGVISIVRPDTGDSIQIHGRSRSR